MTLSTTFQSRISRTKKRLSKDTWAVPTGIAAFLGLLIVLTYAIRTVGVSGSFAGVSVEMPVVSATLEDPAFHRYSEQAQETLRKTTAAVVLTTDAFYFSDLDSFTANIGAKHDKYVVAHEDGQPQLLALLTSMEKWLEERQSQHGIKPDGHLVFLPHGDIPMPIVIQAIAGLRQSGMFQRIVLGGGLL